MKLNIKKINLLFIRNLFSGFINKGFIIFSQILLIPIFISFWGKQFYGEWILISTIPNYLTSVDFGINVTTTTAISGLVANGNYKEALKMYKAANWAFLFLFFIIITIFINAFLFFNWSKILGLQILGEVEVELSLFFLIGNVFISFALGVLLGIYRAEGRYDKFQNFNTLTAICDQLIILFFVINGKNIFLISLFQFFVKAFLYIIFMQNLQKKYNWFKFGIEKNNKLIFQILPTSVYYMIFVMGQGLVMQGTTFLVGKTLGTSALVTFNTVRTLVNSVRSFISIYYYSFLNDFTIYLSKYKYFKAKYLFIKMFTNSLYLTISLVILLFYTGGRIIYIWTNGKIEFEQSFFNFMLLMAFFNTLSLTSYSVMNASNNNRNMGVYYTIFASIAMIAIYKLSYLGLDYIAIILCGVEIGMFFISFRSTWKIVNNNQ